LVSCNNLVSLFSPSVYVMLWQFFSIFSHLTVCVVILFSLHIFSRFPVTFLHIFSPTQLCI
jgi:hypothetical protein